MLAALTVVFTGFGFGGCALAAAEAEPLPWQDAAGPGGESGAGLVMYDQDGDPVAHVHLLPGSLRGLRAGSGSGSGSAALTLSGSTSYRPRSAPGAMPPMPPGSLRIAGSMVLWPELPLGTVGPWPPPGSADVDVSRPAGGPGLHWPDQVHSPPCRCTCSDPPTPAARGTWHVS